MEVTASVEDYLKTIWKAASSGDRMTPAVLAERRAVSGPSASIMLRRLVEAGLVVRDTAGGIHLTGRGEAVALTVVRRHRLLETFLVQVVGMEWDEVDAEAELLEHVLSPRLEERIDDLLGRPTRDPHGDPIPQAHAGAVDGTPGHVEHVEDWSDPLAGAGQGSRFRVRRVSDRDPAALRHLAGVGVRPGVVLEVGAQEPFGGPLWVRPAGSATAVALPPALVELVHGVDAATDADADAGVATP